MENKDFKKIQITASPKQLPDDMLEGISGGKQNRDENGNWDYNVDHCRQWQLDMYHTKYYMKCPNCGERMFNNMDRYDSDAWWYCFWYNRLWCFNCKKWTEELY